MQLLKKSTATTLLVGPVLDSTGAAVTTCVIGDFNITKNGTTAAMAATATATHSHNGNYLLALTTGNTDTEGRLTISVNNAAQAMSTHRYSVLLASVFDALITNATNTTGGLPAATSAIAGLSGTIATTTNITAATGVVLAAVTHAGAEIPLVTATTTTVNLTNLPTITGNWLTAAGLAADAVAEIWASSTAPTSTAIADAILSRNASNVEGSAGEHTLCTVILAMLENTISGTTLTIRRTDGSTTHATKTLTATPGADPITGIQ